MTNAWDRDQPANNSLIQNYASLTRDNFQTIQDGGATFGFVGANFSQQAGNPTNIASKFIGYAKAGTTYTSFFGMNSNGDVIQITDDDFLGGPSQKVNLASIRFGTLAEDLDGNFVCHGYGYVASDGTLTAAKSKNINAGSTTKTGTGSYTIVTDAIYSNANAICLVTPFGTSKTLAASIQTLTESGGVITITLEIWNAASTPAKNDSAFQFMILGGM